MIRLAWIDRGDAVTVVQQCALAGVSRATIYARRHLKWRTRRQHVTG